MLLTLLTGALLVGLSTMALGWLPRADAWWIGLGLASGVGAVAWRARPLAWLLALGLGAVSWGALLAPRRSQESFASLRTGLARIQFEVGRGGCGQQGCWCEARLLACSELEAGSCVAPGVLLGVASDAELPLGARVTALAALKPRVAFRNASGASTWPDLRPPLYASLAHGSAPRIDALSPWDRAVAAARAAIRRALERSLRPPHAGIARALLLGEGSAVDVDLNDAIRGAGVAHVLAVSGMHVTLLAGAAVALLRFLWLRSPLALRWEARRAAAALGVLLAPLIARLCGAAPSAERAAWTSTVMFLLVALGRPPSPLPVSALVVGAYAASAPRAALNPGFVLSVLATAALLTAGPSASGGAVRRAWRESLRAWLATAPFLWLCFGQTSTIALLANVALLPLGTALVPLAAAHLACALLALDSSSPTAWVFELASGAFVTASRFCAGLDPGIALPPLTATEVVAACAVAGCFMLRAGWRLRAIVGSLAGLVALTSEWALRSELAEGALRVTFVDVGQGDAILLEQRGGPNALVDAGGSIGGGPDPGARALVPLLRARRVRALDVVVLSHPHPDHYGGLAAIFAALPVRELWDTGQAEAEDEHGPVASLLARARERGVHVRQPRALCGPPRAFGSAQLEVLAPCPGFDETREANDNSFVLRLTHGARSFLLTGDAEREEEAARLAAGRRLRSDVLKVAHHGSRSSSTPALLRAVAPWLAVVSAGPANRFGHPHGEALERLARAARHVLRTDLAGGVEVVSDGRSLRVRSFEHGPLLVSRGPEDRTRQR